MSALSSLSRAGLIAALLLADARADEFEGGESLMFLCPINVLQRAYGNLTDATDALSVLAVERHVLAICRESQEQLLAIHQNNQRLQEIFGLTITPARASAGDDGAGAAAVVAAAPEPKLELVAVIRRRGETRALVRVDGVSEQVSAGSLLASGHLVEAIGADHVTVVAADGAETRIE